MTGGLPRLEKAAAAWGDDRIPLSLGSRIVLYVVDDRD